MQGLKWNHYIGVQTGSEIRLVTGFENANKMAYWRAEEKPKVLPISTAKDLSWALSINGYRAFVITTLEEYETQPFICSKPSSIKAE